MLLSRRSAINEMRAVQDREKKNAFWVETQGHFCRWSGKPLDRAGGLGYPRPKTDPDSGKGR